MIGNINDCFKKHFLRNIAPEIMYHEKSKLCEICLNFCSSEAYMARENKVDTCIDLVLQESNSKTKLEV